MPDAMNGIMGEIEPKADMVNQIIYLMELYNKRTGRVANALYLNPKTHAKHPLGNSNLIISIRAYQFIQPNILWVGEAS